MKYDKFTADQMAGELKTQCATTGNKVLELFETLAMYPTATPLQRFHNALLCFDEVVEIIDQAHAAALDQLRVEKPELFKDVDYNPSYHNIGKVLEKKPYIEYEGCQFNVSVFADYMNLGRKDMQLGMMNKSIKTTEASVDKMYDRMAARVKTLRSQKEYKKSKPHLVREIIQIKGHSFPC